MRDELLRDTLATLEAGDPPAEVITAARNHMLAVFEGLEPTGVTDAVEDRSAEIVNLVAADEQSHRAKLRRRLWLPALAAAAALLIVLAVGVRNTTPERSEQETPPLAAETRAGAVTTEDPDGGAMADLEPLGELPLRLDGRFTTDILGTTVSFVTDPVWLIRHDAGVIELSLDPTDPGADHLVIARPGSPTELLGDQSLRSYMRTDPGLSTGQANPFVLDGVESLYWRGNLTADVMPVDACEPGVTCLVLYEDPIPVGLRANVVTDLVERPMTDGSNVLLIASISSQNFDLRPFARPFRTIIETITFDDQESGIANN